MTRLLELLKIVGRGTMEPIWLPLAAWTVLALALTLAIGRLHAAHPLLRARLHAALLLLLPAGLVAAAFVNLPGVARHLPDAAFVLPGVMASAGAHTPQANGSVSVLFVVLGLLTSAAGVSALLHGARLANSLARVHVLRHSLPDASEAVQRRAARLARSLGVRRRVRVLVSDDNLPLTFGHWRPVVVVPRSHLDDSDLALVLHHELVHVRHADFARQVVERLVCAAFALHPLVHALHRRAATAREMACDAALLDQQPQERARYARLLYRFATPCPQAPRTAVGIIHSSTLKRRLIAMKDRTAAHRPRFIALLTAALLLSGTLVVACSDVVTDSADAPAPQADVEQADAERSTEAFVVVDQMPEMLPSMQEGLQQVAERIHYPAMAKRAGIEGRVFVQLVVQPDGSVSNVEVTKGIGGGCDEEAVRVARTLQFKPGMMDGKPVPVKLALPVTFELDENAS